MLAEKVLHLTNYRKEIPIPSIPMLAEKVFFSSALNPLEKYKIR
jgi:hypothetical protein